MARKCPDCGHMNDNEMAFCTECGEPLDPQVRLVMELEGKKGPTPYNGTGRIVRNDDKDDDDYTPIHHEEEEQKKFPWVLLLVLAAAAVAAYFFLR